MLIDHLDESLRGKATATLEDIIGNDPEAEKEWKYLRLTVDAVKVAGLYQEVTAARNAWKAELEVAANTSTAIATAAAVEHHPRFVVICAPPSVLLQPRSSAPGTTVGSLRPITSPEIPQS